MKDDRSSKLEKAAKEMYNDYQFGSKFNHKEKRKKNYPLLVYFLSILDKNNNLYDIGCGSGYWMEESLEYGFEKKNVYGIDFALNNIKSLREKGFNARCDDVLNLDIDDNIVDNVICNGVIHHTSDPLKAFSELARITKSGGSIFLGVYNKYNPFFYLVHKMTFPIRYIYWNVSKKILNIVYPVAKIIFQPLSYLVMGKFLDDNTGKTIFVDQVLTPYAHLFSRKDIEKYIVKHNCKLVKHEYTKLFLMHQVIIKVG